MPRAFARSQDARVERDSICGVQVSWSLEDAFNRPTKVRGLHGLSGHSLGGAAAFEACKHDASCAGAVDLDGNLWTDVRHTRLSAPRLLLQHAPSDACDEFCKRAAADFATVMGTGDAEQLSVAGTAHQNFSDAGLMWGIANGIALGSIDAHRMTLITRDAVRSFLDVHLRDAFAADFTATVARYPELTTAKTPS